MRDAIREYCLSFPGAHEDHPWGEPAFKVDGKVFVFAGTTGRSLTVKLPTSALDVLDLPFAKPTGYGLGKSGWVTIVPPEDVEVPLAQVRAWIDESYRAVAKKRRIAELDALRA